MSWDWTCKKCHARNSDMVDSCTNCGKSSNGGCGPVVFWTTVILILASSVVYMMKKSPVNKKKPGGPAVRIVRPKED